MTRRLIVTVIVVVLSAGSAAADPPATPRPLGQWEKLPLPEVKSGRVGQVAMSSDGMIWITCGGGVYYWTGKAFRAVEGGELKTGMYLGAFRGGVDRPLYLTQPGEEERHGKLYRLDDGQARYVSDFYYDVSHEPPGVYVSRSGKLINWGDRFLAVLVDGKWERIEAKLGLRPVILDGGETVWFYYNRYLYVVAADGSITEHKIPEESTRLPVERQGMTRQHGALLGEDKMVLLTYAHRGLEVLDLQTRQPVWSDFLREYFGEMKAYDVFRAGDGSVWVLTGPRYGGKYCFHRISPAGNVSRMEETTRFSWGNSRVFALPHSVLCASDGSVWFGLAYGGIARLKDDAVSIMGWKDGLPIKGTRILLEDARSNIYAVSNEVWVYRPNAKAQPLSEALSLWEEHPGFGPIRDSEGHIWVFLKERPGEASRWDGERWHHMKVPFDATKISRWLTDDRGHVLLCMNAAPLGVFDLSAGGVRRFDYPPEEMVQAAVARGATRFEAGRGFEGCVVLENGRICLTYYRYLQYFDGERWDGIRFREAVMSLHESPRYGFLAHTQDGGYYTYDRGQIVEVEYPRDAKYWLMGPNMLQPFEEELLKRSPELYIPIERKDTTYYLLRKPAHKGLGEDERPDWVRGPALPAYREHLRRARAGGYWSWNGPHRILGLNIIECDFADAPLAGSGVTDIVDDRAGNLWFSAPGTDGTRAVFCKRLDGFTMTLKEFPEKVGRSHRFEAQPHLPGLEAGRFRLLWRLKGGQWEAGEPGGTAVVGFPSAGTHKVEFIGMAPQGGTTPRTTVVTVTSVEE